MKIESNRMELLKEITVVEFMKEDLALYLDTHPTDREALNKYNGLVMQSKALRQNYERLYGPLSEHDSLSGYPWQWINEPWPWEPEANFRL